MKLTFETKSDGSYYTLVKDSYGFTLNEYTPIKNKKPDSKSDSTHNHKSYFYGSIEQAAAKVAHLELQGENLDDIVNTYSAVLEKMVETIKKESV